MSGDITKYNELKKLDTIEFFDFYKRWKADIDEKMKATKELKNKSNG